MNTTSSITMAIIVSSGPTHCRSQKEAGWPYGALSKKIFWKKGAKKRTENGRWNKRYRKTDHTAVLKGMPPLLAKKIYTESDYYLKNFTLKCTKISIFEPLNIKKLSPITIVLVWKLNVYSITIKTLTALQYKICPKHANCTLKFYISYWLQIWRNKAILQVLGIIDKLSFESLST